MVRQHGCGQRSSRGEHPEKTRGVDDVDAPDLHIWVRVDRDCFTGLEDMTCPFHPSAVK